MTQCFTSSGAHSAQPSPTLKQLVAQACQYPPGSIGRQEKLNQIIFEIQRSKKICGNTLKDVVVKPQDSHIQFFFTADIDDKFSLNVKLNDSSITEYFIV